VELPPNHPVYTIGVVAHLLGLHVQTIRQYERLGLIFPCRSLKKTRLYSQVDVERLECIIYLVKHCGVNIAGVKMMVTLSNSHPEIDSLLKSRRISPHNSGPFPPPHTSKE